MGSAPAFAFAFAFAVALVIEPEKAVPAQSQVRVGGLVVPVVLEDSVDSWFQDVARDDGQRVAHDSAIAVSVINAVDVFLFFPPKMWIRRLTFAKNRSRGASDVPVCDQLRKFERKG